MTVMLEVAIGLVFVYLVLSLLSSAIAEALEHFLRYRAHYLRQGIEKLLLGGSATLRAELYNHPLVKSLYSPLVFEGWARGSGPSYIPARQFALALLDLATERQMSAAPASAGAAAPAGGGAAAMTPVAQMLAAINANTALPTTVAGALRTLIRDAGDDMENVKANVRQWFDGSMDRVSGWYKRRAQLVLLIIGAILAVAINVDTLAIVETLSRDSAVRTAIVTAAEQYIRDHPQPPAQRAQGVPTPAAGAEPKGATGDSGGSAAQGNRSLEEVTASVRKSVQDVSKQLGTLGLPVGSRRYDAQLDAQAIDALAANAGDRNAAQAQYFIENRVLGAPQDQFATHFLGWLLTAFAISFGAPFWFDTLNKIMVIRSTVKPREKSREEGSEDRHVSGRK